VNVLVDTSVWSLAFRRSRGKPADEVTRLRELIAEHRVAIIGPIRQELLSGIRDDASFDRLADRLGAFPDLMLDQHDYVEAARFFNTCRAKGVQGSNTDFLICAVAARRNHAIFTTDRDFERFAKHVPINLY
jgi:predicted nucleic acid-binding protein